MLGGIFNLKDADRVARPLMYVIEENVNNLRKILDEDKWVTQFQFEETLGSNAQAIFRFWKIIYVWQNFIVSECYKASLKIEI